MSVDIDTIVRDCEATLVFARKQREQVEAMESKAEANLRKARELRDQYGAVEKNRVLRVVKN